MKRDDVPTLLVEQLAAGVLPEAEARAVREALGESARDRLEAIAADNIEVLAELPPARVVAEIHRRRDANAAPRRRPARGVWLAVPSLAAAAVVLLWIRQRPDPDTDTPALAVTAPHVIEPTEFEPTRSKGLAPHLTVARKRGAEIEQLQDGSMAKPGDVLQLGYVAAGRTHGVILSLDGRGVVTLHHPATAAGSTELQDLGEVALGFAYELDDAPEFERFVFLTFDANAAIDSATIVRAAEALARDADRRQTAALELPETVEQTSLLVRKPTP